MNKSFFISIPITKLKHKLITLETKAGRKIPGIFLPFEANYITQETKDKDAYFMNAKVLVRDEPDQYNKFGFMKHIVDGETYKNATREELEALDKALPFLGNLFDPKYGKDSEGQMDEQVKAPEPIPADEGDDLPF